MLSRLTDRGMPLDYSVNNRFNSAVAKFLSYRRFSDIAVNSINSRFDHSFYGIQPKHNLHSFAGGATINDILPSRIASGTVVIKPDILKLTETSVQFEDGTVEDDIDLIILATGYKIGFPFLNDKSFQLTKVQEVDLYMHVFAPDVQPATIAVIGHVISNASILPIAELQCRCAVRVFKVGTTNEIQHTKCGFYLEILSIIFIYLHFVMIIIF